MTPRLKKHVAGEAAWHQDEAQKFSTEQRHYLVALQDSGLRISSSTYYRWTRLANENGEKAMEHSDIARILIGAI